MSFLKEIKAVLTPKEIVFKEMKKEDADIYTFVFEPLRPLEWREGKHAMFFITHKKIEKAMRLFSIMSCPSENKIAITTKIGGNPSDYKKALLELSPGMKMTLRGPMGPFVLKQDQINCFIAGGIGITPFRSIMKEIDISKHKLSGSIKLFYINSSGSFLFGEELKAMEHEKTSTEFFTDQQVLANRIKQMTSQGDNTVYFIAGTKQMTTSIKQMLIEHGAKKKDIKTDIFIGY
ncbi:MAG: FAD-dependent oxidoreductase [Vallitaleaceae bacterium]|nr:FAD-dependent oxidoreductase [Vallitaleaceae bacterium]